VKEVGLKDGKTIAVIAVLGLVALVKYNGRAE